MECGKSRLMAIDKCFVIVIIFLNVDSADYSDGRAQITGITAQGFGNAGTRSPETKFVNLFVFVGKFLTTCQELVVSTRTASDNSAFPLIMQLISNLIDDRCRLNIYEKSTRGEHMGTKNFP